MIKAFATRNSPPFWSEDNFSRAASYIFQKGLALTPDCKVLAHIRF